MKSPLLPILTLSSLPALLHAAPAAAPVYASHRVTAETIGHAVEIKADLTGAKKLYLVVTDGGDGFGCDWSNWVNPVIHGSFGDKKLTDLKPVKVQTGWGQVGMNKNAGDKPMSVNGQPAGNGFGVHAPSLLEFDLPEGTTAFTGTGALDDGGTSQSNGSSVEFKIYTQTPPANITKASGGALEPEQALEALTAGAGWPGLGGGDRQLPWSQRRAPLRRPDPRP
jgi:hypothetical protein